MVVDHLEVGEVRITLNRMPAKRWTSSGILRAWARARMHIAGDEIRVACAPDEALWLGAWSIVEPQAADAVLLEEGGRATRLRLQESSQLRGLGPTEPLRLPAGAGERCLRLRVEGPAAGTAPVEISLRLLPPAMWAAEADEEPEPLGTEPPLPPRLG